MSKKELDALITDLPTEVSNVKICLFGEPGCGKTVLAFKVAEAITTSDQIVFYVDSAQGYASLVNHPELDSFKSRTKRVRWGRETLQEELIARIENGEYGDVGCIIYDEFSSMVGDDLNWVVTERVKQTNRGTGDEVEQRDYGTNLRRITRLIDAAVKSNINIIFLAHAKVEGEIRKKLMPNFRDSIYPVLNGQVHVIGYVSAVVEQDAKGKVTADRKVQLQPSKNVDAKSRIGVIPQATVSTDDFVAGIAKWASTLTNTPDTDYTEGIEV